MRSKVGILACDHVEGADLLAASGGLDYSEMYSRLLLEAGADFDFEVFDLAGGRELPGPSECDAWLITGARYDSFSDDVGWIIELREWIVRAARARRRIVGVCFGHQVIAHALGGRAERSSDWKAGPMKMKVASTRWFEGGEVVISAMHRDEVTALPPGAVAVGTGGSSRNAMFLVGDTILGIQDHPEYTPEYAGALIESRRASIGATATDEALARLAGAGLENLTVGGWLVRFLADERK